MSMSPERHVDLLDKAVRIKKRFLGMYKAARAGHVGCSLSVAEIITFVRFGWMAESDEIILSKGHAAAVLYSMLAEEGLLSGEEVATFYQNGTFLAAHPPANKLARIPFATGSLGHGLSIAGGLGMAQRLKGGAKRIFCITSDGELNEGSTWEAALFIAHHQLSNVTWFIDRNHLQGFGRTEDVMKLAPLDRKLEAFGFHVITARGHDFNSLAAAGQEASLSDQPVAILCETIKGRGWREFEGEVDCHYLPMTDAHYALILADIEAHRASFA